MSPADLVWNRACAEAGRPRTLTAPGDRALADMVNLHSLAMNSGVLHAVESRTDAELEHGLAGYRYFGLAEPATVIADVAERARSGAFDDDALDALESEADERYATAVPRDGVLVDAFETRYHADPKAFAPPE